MLSRVADSLYWMSRYLERAEHTVRMLDVNFSMTLDPSSTSEEGRWKRVLAALGNPAGLAWNGKLLLARPCACVGQKQSGVDHRMHLGRARECKTSARTDQHRAVAAIEPHVPSRDRAGAARRRCAWSSFPRRRSMIFICFRASRIQR